MLSTLFQLAVVSLAALTATEAQSFGEYFRPSGAQVSGFPNARTEYLRSPCPALNTLANHGFIPRDGRNITPETLRAAMMGVFNVDRARADQLTSGLPRVLTLAFLSKHNFIEHDVSLVRADLHFGFDPVHVDSVLAKDLLSRARGDGRLGINEVAKALKDRHEWCMEENPDCDFRAPQRFITFSEAAGFLQVFGANGDATISVEHAESFLVNERIPKDWRASRVPVTKVELDALAKKVEKAAGISKKKKN
jgi:hypothetical protein